MRNELAFVPVEADSLPELATFWNRNFSPAFHVTEEILRGKILDDADLFLPGTFLCREEGRVAGLIVAKQSDNSLPEYRDAAWLSALAVDADSRRAGLGSRMYRKAEEELKAAGVRKLIAAGEMNNFFSGIPDPSPANRGFFEKLGFTLNAGEHYDLCADVSKIDFDALPVSIRRRPEFATQVLTGELIPALDDFLCREFPGRWRSEVKRFLENGGNRAHLMLLRGSGGEVEGFCKSHVAGDGEDGGLSGQLGSRWGSLGPIGISAEIRGLGQGSVLLGDSLRYLKKLGAHNVLIDWTVLKDFYGRFGFTPWRTYLGAYKTI